MLTPSIQWLLAVTVLAAPLRATTYVVDDTPGPGVDFSNIQSALTLAGPLDVILVRPGFYAGFTLQVGLEIRADPAAFIGQANFQSIPTGERAVLYGGVVNEIQVHACAGGVLLEHLASSSSSMPSYPGAIVIQGSSDVRLRDGQFFSLDITSSRVEVTASTIMGYRGEDGCFSTECSQPGSHVDGLPGGTALRARIGADVHLSETNVMGGFGGQAGALSFNCPEGMNGAGGTGLQMDGGSTVLATGTGATHIAGGVGGEGGICPSTGFGPVGAAVIAQGGAVLQYSNVSLFGSVLGSAVIVVPADPCLTSTGNGSIGTQLTFTIHGQPGDLARLRLGRRMIVEDLPSVAEDRLTIALRSYSLGLLPAGGTGTFLLNVPGTLPPGFVLFAQGSTTSPSGEVRLTQSLPVVVH